MRYTVKLPATEEDGILRYTVEPSSTASKLDNVYIHDTYIRCYISVNVSHMLFYSSGLDHFLRDEASRIGAGKFIFHDFIDAKQKIIVFMVRI